MRMSIAGMGIYRVYKGAQAYRLYGTLGAIHFSAPPRAARQLCESQKSMWGFIHSIWYHRNWRLYGYIVRQIYIFDGRPARAPTSRKSKGGTGIYIICSAPRKFRLYRINIQYEIPPPNNPQPPANFPISASRSAI